MTTPGWLRRLLRLGVDAETSPVEVRHVLIINGINLIALAASLVTLAMPLPEGASRPFRILYVLLSGVLPPALVLLLNAARRHVTAAVVFLAYVLISTAGAVLLFGALSGVHYYYLAVIVLIFACLPARRRWLALALALVYAGTYAAICVGFESLAGNGGEAVRRTFQTHLSLATLGTALGAFYTARVTTATRKALRELQGRTDALLRAVLPADFVDPLREGALVVGRRYERGCVLVCDIAGFTRLAEEAAAEDIVGTLGTIFSEFDMLCQAHGVDKVKTVGDAYVAAIGLSRPTADLGAAAAALARDMRAAVDGMPLCQARGIRVRIGIGVGSLVAGVVGTSKLAYDVWGPAVDAAFAMEGEAAPGEIKIAGAA